MTATTRKRACIYCRISRDRTGEEAGVHRQEQDCRDHVTRNGWDLVEVLVDNDLSAYSGKPRPAYQHLAELVRAGTCDVVVSWHPDRLTRSPRELEDLIDLLEAARVEVSTVRAGNWDLSTRSGRTQARLIGTVARDNSEATAERLQAMHAEKARNGEYRGSTRHYGYKPNGDGGLDIVPKEAKVIREAARRVLAGETVHAVVVDLNARGVATVKGKLWRTQTLRRTLTSWTVCGRREHKGEDVGRAKWDAILARSQRDKLHRLIHDPDRRRPTPARVSLLASIVRCADCGTKMITQRRQNGRRVYVCPASTLGGCGGPQIGADHVDELVTETVMAAVDTEALAAVVEGAAERGDADDSSSELEEIDTELEALATDLGERRITRREWLAARAPLVAARDAAKAKDVAGSRSTALAPYLARKGALANAWPTLTLEQQRAIVAAVVDRVVISRATKRGPVFDADRVSIEWRA